MTQAKEPSLGAHRAEALYRLLLDFAETRPVPPLPRLGRLAALVPDTFSAYEVYNALSILRNSGRIRWQSGTRSVARGHQAIRIVATGAVLRTAGCPFEAPLPEQRGA